MQTISIYDTKKLTTDIITPDNKILYIAWASASGKSYFAEELKKELEAQGKKVLALSSDNYYVDNTRLKHLIYGTFDHPNLIKYEELAEAIDTFLETHSIDIPQYSFIESRRTGYNHFSGEVDHIIVEWLYTLSCLPLKKNALSFYVDSDSEELIMRRLIRDQERTAQAPNLIIDDISKVFPMRNIFGVPQKRESDYIITNGYEILEKQGDISHYRRREDAIVWEKIDEVFFVDYEYNDLSHDNGTLVVSETYKDPAGDLDYVVLTKRKNTLTHDTEQFKTLNVRLNQPGIITTIHALAQLAWLKLINTVHKTISQYKQEDKIITLKHRGEDTFEKIS